MAASKERIELDGETMFRRNGGYMQYHQTTITIEPGKVTTEVEGHPLKHKPGKSVPSEHPAVESYLREVDKAMTATAYGNRQVQPIFKADKKRRKRKSIS